MAVSVASPSKRKACPLAARASWWNIQSSTKTFVQLIKCTEANVPCQPLKRIFLIVNPSTASMVITEFWAPVPFVLLLFQYTQPSPCITVPGKKALLIPVVTDCPGPNPKSRFALEVMLAYE